MITSVRKRNRTTNTSQPTGIQLFYNRTAEEERELKEISDEEMASSSSEEEDGKVFNLKERQRLKKKAEREQRKADRKVRRLLEQKRARSTENSTSLAGFVVDEESDDATVSEDDGPSFESSRAVVDSDDEDKPMTFG
jgi:hypothetical protein